MDIASDSSTVMVTELFFQQARLRPDAPAIEISAAAGSGPLANRTITYGALAESATALARFVQESGEPGDRVAVITHDEVELATALLGITRAGRIYFPLDPATPAERLRSQLRHASPRICLVGSDMDASLPRENLAPGSVRFFADLANTAQPEVEAKPVRSAGPDGACVLFYTSGTTGAPKGILSTGQAIAHFTLWERDLLDAGPGTRVARITSPGFDASLRDFLLPLTSGGTVCVAATPARTLEPAELAAWLREARVNVLHTTPSIFRGLLVTLDPGDPPALNDVLLAGETLWPADAARFFAAFGHGARLWNLYGPSETTMIKFFHRVNEGDARSSSIPVGHGLPGVRAVLLNSAGTAVAPGEIGEVFIETPFALAGYFQDQAQTAERFTARPDGGGTYRTGDFGRLRPDGGLEFLGRRDGQLKIRGVRVETAEVEFHLRALPSVRDLALVDRTAPGGETYLCAFLVSDQPIDAAALRLALARHLPAAMVPAVFVAMNAIPRTLNGKLDRRALPADPAFAARPPHREPRDAREQELARVWSEVLGLPRIGIDDDFFALGGHSITATRVLTMIRKIQGRAPALADFFGHPTIAGLSRFMRDTDVSHGATPHADSYRAVYNSIDNRLFAMGDSILVPLRRGASANGATIVLFHPAAGNLFPYLPLLPLLDPSATVLGIQHPLLTGDRAALSLEELARRYAETLAARISPGPLVLAGWSFGGTVAHATACLLVQREPRRAPPEVVLIDSYTRGPTAKPDHALVMGLAYLAADLLNVPPRPGADVPYGTVSAARTGAVMRLVVDQFGIEWRELAVTPAVAGLSARLVGELEQRSPWLRLVPAGLLRRLPVAARSFLLVLAARGAGYLGSIPVFATIKLIKLFCENTALLHRFRPTVFPGPVTLLLSDESDREAYDLPAVWRAWCAREPVLRKLPGNHYALLKEPALRDVAAAINARLPG